MLLQIDKSYPREVLSFKNFSNRKIIAEYIVKRGGWSETSNLGCFSIWSTECVEEADFGQLNTITQLRIKIKSVWHIVT